MTQDNPNKTQVIFALLTVQILFGVNYVLSKMIVGIFPPLLWASLRVIISTALLAVIAASSKRTRPTFKKSYLGSLVLFALLGIVINQSSFLTGLRYTTATNSAILNTLIPVFTLLFVTLAGQEPATWKRILGFCSALAGVLVLRKVESFTLSDQTILGDGLTVLNCISYALFLTLSKKFMSENDPLWNTTGLFAIGGFFLTALALPDWIHFQWPAINATILGCMLFSIFGSTLLAYYLNLWALSRTKSSSVALFIYVQPVVASLLAWVAFGEIITLRTILSSLLIFSGMLLALAR